MRFPAALALACVLFAVPAWAQEPSYEARLGLYTTGRVPAAEWRWDSQAASAGAGRGAVAAISGGVIASWYDCVKPGQCSRRKITASGERFNPNAMTAAHRSLPFGTRVRVCLRGCVVVRLNDRGPFIRGRSLDLSRAAARAIGLAGVGRVSLEKI